MVETCVLIGVLLVLTVWLEAPRLFKRNRWRK